MTPGPAMMTTDLDLPVFARGKVRDTYELHDDRLLMIATDRVSAFDVVLPNGIPDKGRVLTQLSIWWFSQTHTFQENHLVSGMVPDLPGNLKHRREELSGRFMIVRKAERIDFECVVRGYLAGSAWSEYREHGTVAGERLPAGLVESQKLAEPIFTPATKADSGHDENITFKKFVKALGSVRAHEIRDASLALFNFASEAALKHGLILADTKFEFGLVDKRLILIDEVLTPDSSRYWDRTLWQPGTTPPSYDKQFVRDWLTASGWNKEPPGPELPPDVVDRTRELYLAAYHQMTGRDLFYKEESKGRW
ncbi:MAG TPA: phosphoribosylaminoimidazolesuccinocarboxamide synthase [Candidatus Dormibacteraeota bacterium]|nr:phosphoribosylaminoimidazolesuccinocarboxamide synthase [Candidatus Dormibacteraeota bacterium]